MHKTPFKMSFVRISLLKTFFLPSLYCRILLHGGKSVLLITEGPRKMGQLSQGNAGYIGLNRQVE